MDCCFIYLFGVLHHFQHCTGHITTGSWKGRGNQYLEFIRDLYCNLTTNGKQLPAFPLEAVPGTELRPQRWEARVIPLCHRGPEMDGWHLAINCMLFHSAGEAVSKAQGCILPFLWWTEKTASLLNLLLMFWVNCLKTNVINNYFFSKIKSCTPLGILHGHPH